MTSLFTQPQFIAPLVGGVINILLGIFMLVGHRENMSYRLFFFLSVSIGVWNIFVGSFNILGAIDPVWTTLENTSGIFIPLFFLLFFMNFPSNEDVVPVRQKSLVIGVGIILILLSAFRIDLFVTAIKVVNGLPSQSPGPLYFLLALYHSFYFFMGLVYLFWAYKKSTGRLRAQIIAGLLGLSIAVAGALSTNLFSIIFVPSQLYWFGSIFTLIGTVSIAYMLLEAEDSEKENSIITS